MKLIKLSLLAVVCASVSSCGFLEGLNVDGKIFFPLPDNLGGGKVVVPVHYHGK